MDGNIVTKSLLSANLILFFSLSTLPSWATPIPQGTPHYQLAANSFVYNPKTLKWHAMKNGKIVRSGSGSGGKVIARMSNAPVKPLVVLTE
jgi:hypothetical protein